MSRISGGDFRTYAPLHVGWDGRKKYFGGGAIADLRVITRALTAEEVADRRVVAAAEGRALKAECDVVQRREGCAPTLFPES